MYQKSERNLGGRDLDAALAADLIVRFEEQTGHDISDN